MIGFGPIADLTGLPGVLLQLILGEGFHVGDVSIWHVFMVIDGETCVEAMPGGAREASLAGRWTSKYAYVQIPEDYPGQSMDAAEVAWAMIGTPYSLLSYLALAAWRLGIGTPRLEAWINRQRDPEPIEVTRGTLDAFLPVEAICSVLADQAWSIAGKQVMPKGTPHQCVTPGALATALLQMPGARWLWPGRD